MNLKKSMDTIKRRISEVLKLFKESLEEKHAKNMSELQNKLKEAELPSEGTQLIPKKYISSNSKKTDIENERIDVGWN